MKRTLTWLIGIIVLIGLYFLVRSAITIVPIADVEAQQQAEVFDAPAYVEANWQQRILPAADEKAVDLAQVLNAFEVDSNGLAKKEQLVDVANSLARSLSAKRMSTLCAGAAQLRPSTRQRARGA